MNENLKMFENVQACLRPDELARLDDKSLLMHFREEKWNHTNSVDRLQLLQEIENRRAKADGRPPVKLIVKPMEQSCFGVHGYVNGEERIAINPRFLVKGLLFKKSNSAIFNAANALNTVLHEGRHAYQCYAVQEGKNISNLLRLEWLVTMVAYEGDDYLIYCLQNVEMDARRFARREVAKINDFFNRIGAPDPSFALQTIKDVQREKNIICLVRRAMTHEKIDACEKKVLDRFKERYPNLDVRGLRLFDHARFILDHPEINDPREMLERLDRMADEKLALKDGKHLNRIEHHQLNGLKA